MGKFIILTSIVGLVADVITIALFLVTRPSASMQLPGLSVRVGELEVIILTGLLLFYGLVGLFYVIVKGFRKRHPRIRRTPIEGTVSFVISLVCGPIVLMWMKLLADYTLSLLGRAGGPFFTLET